MTHATQRGRRPLSIGILTAVLAVVMLATGCGSETGVTEGTTTGTAGSASSTAASTAATTVTSAATAVMTSGTRPLSGPQAQNSQLALRSGETRVVVGTTAETELVFAWVELENLTDSAFTVSSLLSVSMVDSGTGNPSLAPNVPAVLGKLAAFDSGAATLDGEMAARGRIAGWVYGEFPTGLAGIRIQIVLRGPDNAQTEPLSLDLAIR